MALRAGALQRIEVAEVPQDFFHRDLAAECSEIRRLKAAAR